MNGEWPMSKRALVCAPRMPAYDREGGSQRVHHLIELLREAGWSVSFVARYATGSEQYARALRQMGVVTYAGDESALMGDEYLTDFASIVEAGRFDIAILAFWEVAERYLPQVQSFSPETRVIVDSIDLHFLRLARKQMHGVADGSTVGLLDLKYADEMIREINIHARADAILTVSPKEAALLDDYLAESVPTYSVPLLEDMEPSVVPLAERTGIVFVANFRHPPNVEAFTYFCNNVLPRIDTALLARHRVNIVGSDTHTMRDRIPAALRESVQIVSWVPSVETYYQQARVAIVPLLHGAGTKTKLIQSLMISTPSVSTTVGVEGLDVRDGEAVLIADTPEAFARAVERLLKDDGLWQHIVTQGHERIARNHSRAAVRKRFFAMLDEVLKRLPRGSSSRQRVLPHTIEDA